MKSLDPAQRQEVARLASKGDIFKSPAAVVSGLNLLGKHWWGSAKGTNRFLEPFGFQYLHRTQVVFKFQTIQVPVYSVGWDASRLSGHDFLATTIYNPGLELAVWAQAQDNRQIESKLKPKKNI